MARLPALAPALLGTVLAALVITGCANAVAPGSPSAIGPTQDDAASSAGYSGASRAVAPGSPIVSPGSSVNAPGSPIGPPNQGGSANPGTPADAARAWAAFPIATKPRPIVLLGESVDGPASGFRSDEDKLAMIDGRVMVGVPLPTGPTTSAGYPTMSPAQAAAQLALRSPQNPQTSKTLVITAAKLVQHPFLTDRGQQPLPAWAFALDGVADDVYVLAVTAAARYPVPLDDMYGAGPARVSPDGRSLSIYYTARHDSTGPCDPGFSSSLDVAQSSASVVVLVVTITRDPPPTPYSNVACPAIGVAPPSGPLTPGTPGTRTIQLAAPLGARVAVNEVGRPFEVSPA
jgi:hypothetical protein